MRWVTLPQGCFMAYLCWKWIHCWLYLYLSLCLLLWLLNGDFSTSTTASSPFWAVNGTQVKLPNSVIGCIFVSYIKHREMYGQAPLKDDEYVLERRITAFKWTMMVHHVLSFILALVTFCLCIWIRIDLDFWEWVVEIDWYSYWYAMYVIMITMVIVIINNLIGAYGIIWVILISVFS